MGGAPSSPGHPLTSASSCRLSSLLGLLIPVPELGLPWGVFLANCCSAHPFRLPPPPGEEVHLGEQSMVQERDAWVQLADPELRQPGNAVGRAEGGGGATCGSGHWAEVTPLGNPRLGVGDGVGGAVSSRGPVLSSHWALTKHRLQSGREPPLPLYGHPKCSLFTCNPTPPWTLAGSLGNEGACRLPPRTGTAPGLGHKCSLSLCSNLSPATMAFLGSLMLADR